jgi:hypothetical protein
MSLPLSIPDISLWLAATAIILLVTSELLFSYPKLSMHLLIEKKQLRLTALGCGIGFLVTVVMRIFYPF